MISRWQKYISVPCHPHRFTQDAVSDFLCFSISVYSSSSDWLQMATLFTEGWGIRCWRKMESSKSTSHSRSLVPSSVEALGFQPPRGVSEDYHRRWSLNPISGRPACSGLASGRRQRERPHNSHTENNYSDPPTPTKLWECLVSKVCFNRNISIMHCSLYKLVVIFSWHFLN